MGVLRRMEDVITMSPDHLFMFYVHCNIKYRSRPNMLSFLMIWER
jgi:hypothetical protein